MPSQLDLDQGGTSREWALQYLGPTVGWVRAPARNVLSITAPGTYTIDPSISRVEVNTAAAVTIILPAAADPAAGAGALPGLFAKSPIVIADVGGHAGAFPITIQRNNTNENVAGLVSITISVAYGTFELRPSSQQPGWTF